MLSSLRANSEHWVIESVSGNSNEFWKFNEVGFFFFFSFFFGDRARKNREWEGEFWILKFLFPFQVSFGFGGGEFARVNEMKNLSLQKMVEILCFVCYENRIIVWEINFVHTFSPEQLHKWFNGEIFHLNNSKCLDDSTISDWIVPFYLSSKNSQLSAQFRFGVMLNLYRVLKLNIFHNFHFDMKHEFAITLSKIHKFI